MSDLMEMRPMPDDFWPEIGRNDGVVVAHHRVDGSLIRLGFVEQPDETENARATNALRQSVWQAAELIRLGHDVFLPEFIKET